jgi:flagellar L-ring protein precursor FlgH
MRLTVHRPWRVFAAAVCAGLLALLQGCQSLAPARVDFTPPAYVTAPSSPAAQAPTGSIYQNASYRPLFEDYRARVVGDAITIQIVEVLAASQSNTSTQDKTGSVSESVTAVPFVNSASLLGRLKAGGASDNSFSGKGSTQTSNTFTGTITATVTQVLPNGHLVISGEKQVGVNQAVDVLRFTGEVDPRNIQAGNVVLSSQVANVRLEQRGRGQQADSQALGWLARIFLNVLPF